MVVGVIKKNREKKIPIEKRGCYCYHGRGKEGGVVLVLVRMRSLLILIVSRIR